MGLVEGYSIRNQSRRCEERYSESYPGLLTQYNTYDFLIDWEDNRDELILTQGEISKEQSDEFDFTEHFESGEPRVTTTWTWVTIEEASSGCDKYKACLKLLGVIL